MAQQLTWLQERAFDFAYDGRKRKLWLAYLLALPLGGFGAHRFYLGRVRSACLMFSMCAGASLTAMFSSRQAAAGAATWPFAVGAILIASVWSWAIADLFSVPAMVRAANQQIETEIRRRIRAGQPI